MNLDCTAGDRKDIPRLPHLYFPRIGAFVSFVSALLAHQLVGDEGHLRSQLLS